MELPPIESDVLRRRAVAMAVALTANTPLAPQRYERYLLGCYQQGKLSIDQVLELLETSVYQLVYRSRATQLLEEVEIQKLLEASRRYNAAYAVTGLLLYSDGRFVQVLEGKEKVVRELFVRIQRDPRHSQVVTVSEGPGPSRQFADWDMGFGYLSNQAAEQVLAALDAPLPENESTPDDPRLQTLLQAFGVH